MVTGGAVPRCINELNWHFLEKMQPLEKKEPFTEHYLRVSNLSSPDPGRRDLPGQSTRRPRNLFHPHDHVRPSLFCTYTLEVIKYRRGWRPGRWGDEGQLYPNKGHREAQQRRKCCLQFPSLVKSRYAAQWLQVHFKGNFLSPSQEGETWPHPLSELLFTFHYGPLCTLAL